MVSYQPGATDWWRFDRYEVSGSYIRPAEGAQLNRYDPWEKDAGRGRSKRAYQELIELIEDVRGGPFLWTSLRPGSEEKVLAWCEKHGLLGLLLHETVSVTFQAQWSLYEPEQSRQVLVAPSITTIDRLVDRWRENTRTYDDLLQPPGEKQADTPLEDEEYLDRMPRRRALIQTLNDDSLVELDLEESWGRFFPAVKRENAKTFRYPAPPTEQFWRAYGESIGDFMKAAGALHQLNEGLSRIREHQTETEDDQIAAQQALALMPRLLSPVSPGVVVDENGEMSLKWVGASLLSVYAMMAVQDFIGDAIPRRCPACNSYFLKKSGQKATYCSERCRQRAQKRTQRVNQVQKREERDGPTQS